MKTALLMPGWIAGLLVVLIQMTASGVGAAASDRIELPRPVTDGEMSVERAILKRRSVRQYGEGALKIEQIAQLLWAAQGVTFSDGRRTAPSAGALYPLEVYLVVGAVTGIEPGLYRYEPGQHTLYRMSVNDSRHELAKAAYGQRWMAAGSALFVITAIYERTTIKYGKRGMRYAHMEAGHAAQNVFLQATALGLETVVVGAFDDEAVAKLLQSGEEERPLYLIPVGLPQ